MSAFFVGQHRQLIRATWSIALVLFVAGCSNRSQDRFQGYVEGEFVYVASPLAGQLETLSVQRGQQVTTDQPLFALDETAEKAAREQIQAALVLSERELARQEKLFRTGVAASRIWIGPVPREIRTRSDSIRQIGVSIRKSRRRRNPVWSTTRFFARANGLPRASRSSSCCHRKTSRCACSFPKRTSARFITATAQVQVDGVKESFVGKVSYISPKAEYTPPVIYSRETRAKLVFMVELIFDPQAAADLHPGQPVDVQFRSK